MVLSTRTLTFIMWTCPLSLSFKDVLTIATAFKIESKLFQSLGIFFQALSIRRTPSVTFPRSSLIRIVLRLRIKRVVVFVRPGSYWRLVLSHTFRTAAFREQTVMACSPCSRGLRLFPEYCNCLQCWTFCYQILYRDMSQLLHRR